MRAPAPDQGRSGPNSAVATMTAPAVGPPMAGIVSAMGCAPRAGRQECFPVPTGLRREHFSLARTHDLRFEVEVQHAASIFFPV